ncbi:MAG TPA: NADH-quinone oxidoreductase subunit L [Bellilinea sp.]|nr:NADH-quinone oxidoreductase subunit L [Bellilinea sp.]
MISETLVWLIPLPPLLAFFLIVVFTNRNKALSHWLALIAAGLSWAISMVIFGRAVRTEGLAEHPFAHAIDWLPTGTTSLKIGIQIDPLSAVVLFFVAITVLMIFIYSTGYHNYGQPAGQHDRKGLPPEGAEVKDAKGKLVKVPSIEPMYSRFFALISLFAFAMFLLVVTDNLLTLYVGWEIMGLCSYLLIGFWYAKESARKAMIKAFLTTRVGDVFMLLGLAALYALTGTLNYQEILGNPAVLEQLAGTLSPVFSLSWAALIGLLIFIGTVGKSAQFPLHIWLPDAMEGPTPVSAMIHAATMVSAGVYLVIRFFPLLSAGWEPGGTLTTPMLVMGIIGSFTAIFAATIAVAQNDIKRVLAFSTISQLGYMIAALGVGAYAAAAFHLVTHAFFKALLFLGSGSIIHGMEHGIFHTGEHIDPQNMLNMGGLRKKMPITFWTFLIGGLALSGFPLITAGFWSKDEILSGAFKGGQMGVFITLALAALLTAFYTARQITLTFLGKPRSKAAEHAQESKWTMTAPLAILSVFAIGAGWAGIPADFPGLGGLLPNWFEEFVGSMLHFEHVESVHSLVPLITSLVVALGGLALGWVVYKGLQKPVDPLEKSLGGLHTVLKNKYYIDEFYQAAFIRPALWLADVFTYKFLDQTIIDGVLHGIARFGVWLGNGLRNIIDLPVVNGAGDNAARGTRGLGLYLRSRQSGRIQQYMVIAISLLVLAGLVIYFTVGLG